MFISVLPLLLNRFNQKEGQDENAIVTSTGQFVIAWDLAKVKKGKYDAYEIKKYEDHVVQDNFKFGDDKEIVSRAEFGLFTVTNTMTCADCRAEQQCSGCQQEESEAPHPAVAGSGVFPEPFLNCQLTLLSHLCAILTPFDPSLFMAVLYFFNLPLS